MSIRLPSASDRRLEPLLEEMADNAAFLWTSRRPLISRRLAEILGRRETLAVSLAIFYVAGIVLAVPSVLAGTAALAISWAILRAVFGRPARETSLLGRPLHEWADLASTPISAEEVARGLWARRAIESEAQVRRTTCGALLAASILGTMALREAAGWGVLWGYGAVGACLIAGFSLVRRWRNPWLALEQVVVELEERAPRLLKGFRPTAADADDKAVRLEERWNAFQRSVGLALGAAVAGVVAIMILGGVFVWMAGAFTEGRPIFALAIVGSGMFLVGCVWAAIARARQARAAEERFHRLVLLVRGAMNGACVLVHGPDATTTGVPLESFFGVLSPRGPGGPQPPASVSR